MVRWWPDHRAVRVVDNEAGSYQKRNNNMNKRKNIGKGALLAAVVGLTFAAAGPVEAKGGDATIVRGTCTGGGTWKLKGKHDDGVIEIEFEVDTNRVGQKWNVGITDNGRNVFSGSRVTLAPSGSFEVERRTANLSGSDRFVARATRNGQVCQGTLTL
jgi:hypothetical protein